MRIYTNTKDTWTAMFAALHTAKKSIYIEMYIFSDDTEKTHNFVQLLTDKASGGVRVVLLLDAFGSMDLKNASIEKLQRAGVEILFFRHWIHRTHRKLIIIDEDTAFVGGVNITKHAMDWHDLCLRVRGYVVQKLLSVFSRTYILAGGKKSIIQKPIQKKPAYKVRKWVLEHTPFAGRFAQKRYYMQACKKAQRRFVCVTPYFVPHRWFLDAVQDMIKRGVVVELLIPQNTDSKLLDIVNTYYAATASLLGVRVYVFPSVNHAKALLIDDMQGLVGSGNIDSLSFSFNNELGIFFTDKTLVYELGNTITAWKKQSTLLQIDTYKKLPWYYGIYAYLIRLIHPFL